MTMVKIELDQYQLEFIFDSIADFLGEQEEFINQFACVVEAQIAMSSGVKIEGNKMIEKTLSLFQLHRRIIVKADFIKEQRTAALEEVDFNIKQLKALREKLKTCPVGLANVKANYN